MITLGVRGIASRGFDDVLIGRVTRRPVPPQDRADLVLTGVDDDTNITGYLARLCESSAIDGCVESVPTIHAVGLDHLEDGDLVGLYPNGYVRTLYRRASRHNAIFATDRCNSLCLMCSQPPRDVDETGIVDQHLRLISLIDPKTEELGITGGEPTLLGDGLLTVLSACRDRLPSTALHILSNGRTFADATFAKRLAGVGHPNLMIGIPVYSDIDWEHDHVVQARGAFEETVRGLQNLGRYGVPVEIRVVIHRLTYRRLPELAEFIYRNLTFVSQVALMGLEITGFTIPNLDNLWIDPVEYRRELQSATMFLAARGVRVLIYNHQLCTVPASLWPFCCRSISDWKNEYLAQCESCAVREECGGFFASGVQRRFSAHIRPIVDPTNTEQQQGSRPSAIRQNGEARHAPPP
jgi:His-Xaa-Ser system radical SAM maturase HxsC